MSKKLNSNTQKIKQEGLKALLRWGGGEGGRSSLLFPPSPPPSSLQFPPLLPSSPPSSIEFSPAPFRSPPQFPSLLPNWGGSQEGTRENWGENKRELERTKGNSPQFSPVPPKVQAARVTANPPWLYLLWPGFGLALPGSLHEWGVTAAPTLAMSGGITAVPIMTE